MFEDAPEHAAVLLYQSGKTIREVATAVGLSYAKAQRALKDADVTMRGTSQFTAGDVAVLGALLDHLEAAAVRAGVTVDAHLAVVGGAEDVASLYWSGKSVRDICDITGQSYGKVHRMLSDAGVERRPSSLRPSNEDRDVFEKLLNATGDQAATLGLDVRALLWLRRQSPKVLSDWQQRLVA